MNKAMKEFYLKNNKKGFTMVELIIVIAVLAILCSIAIPLVGTVIRASQLSTMESDSVTVESVLTAALVDYEAGNKNAQYNSAPATGSTKVKDVLIENNIDDIDFSRNIGGVMYYMTWKNRKLEITNSPTNSLSDTMTLYDLKTA